MSGHHPWSTLQAAIDADPERRERVDLEKRLIADVQTLTELRQTRGMTQETLAEAWETSQANVSRVEHERDVYLSTLRSYIAALGGRLELIAVFPDQTIKLGGPRVAPPDASEPKPSLRDVS
jgi:DNA-binding XRE family transcriptional regulator